MGALLASFTDPESADLDAAFAGDMKALVPKWFDGSGGQEPPPWRSTR